MDIQPSGSIIENPKPEFLTLEEVADILRVNPTTISRRVQRGEITAVHIGRRVLIRKTDLDMFISSNSNGG